MKPCHPSNAPDRCKWCGDKLGPWLDRPRGGYGGDGLFCTKTCGYLFAVEFARAGHRLREASGPTPTEVRRAQERKDYIPPAKCPVCGKNVQTSDAKDWGYVNDGKPWAQCRNLDCELYGEELAYDPKTRTATRKEHHG